MTVTPVPRLPVLAVVPPLFLPHTSRFEPAHRGWTFRRLSNRWIWTFRRSNCLTEWMGWTFRRPLRSCDSLSAQSVYDVGLPCPHRQTTSYQARGTCAPTSLPYRGVVDLDRHDGGELCLRALNLESGAYSNRRTPICLFSYGSGDLALQLPSQGSSFRSRLLKNSLSQSLGDVGKYYSFCATHQVLLLTPWFRSDCGPTRTIVLLVDYSLCVRYIFNNIPLA